MTHAQGEYDDFILESTGTCPYIVPIHKASEPLLTTFLMTSLYSPRHLRKLSLSLETKGLVNPEFAENGENSGSDRDAGNISDHLCQRLPAVDGGLTQGPKLRSRLARDSKWGCVGMVTYEEAKSPWGCS